MGDGQTLAIRLQTSSFYSTYSFNFVEPWLEVFVQFSCLYHQLLNTDMITSQEYRQSQSFQINGFNVGMAKDLEYLTIILFYLSNIISILQSKELLHWSIHFW